MTCKIGLLKTHWAENENNTFYVGFVLVPNYWIGKFPKNPSKNSSFYISFLNREGNHELISNLFPRAATYRRPRVKVKLAYIA